MNKEPKIFSSSFIQDVFTLLLGNSGAQAIAFLSIPILTHLYTPTHFGILGTYTAIVLFFTIISCGGYEQAIMLGKNDEEALDLLRLSNLLTLGVVGLLSLILLCNLSWIHHYLEVAEITFFACLIPLSIWAEGWSLALKVWLNRLAKYKSIATARFLQASTTAIVSIILGWQGYLTEGLIMGLVAGQWIKMLWMLLAAKWWRHTVWSSFDALKKVAQSYKDFFRFGIIGTGLNTMSHQLPFLILPFYFDKSVLGFYNLAMKVLALPQALLGMSIGDVFFKRATQAYQESKMALSQLTWSTFKYLVGLSLAFGLVVFLLAPYVFVYVFGEAWDTAAKYAQILTPMAMVSFVVAPLSYLIDVRQKLKAQLWYNLLLFVSRFLVLYIGGMYLLAEPTMLAFVIISVLASIFYLVYLLRLGRGD